MNLYAHCSLFIVIWMRVVYQPSIECAVYTVDWTPHLNSMVATDIMEIPNLSVAIILHSRKLTMLNDVVIAPYISVWCILTRLIGARRQCSKRGKKSKLKFSSLQIKKKKKIHFQLKLSHRILLGWIEERHPSFLPSVYITPGPRTNTNVFNSVYVHTLPALLLFLSFTWYTTYRLGFYVNKMKNST